MQEDSVIGKVWLSFPTRFLEDRFSFLQAGSGTRGLHAFWGISSWATKEVIGE